MRKAKHRNIQNLRRAGQTDAKVISRPPPFGRDPATDVLRLERLLTVDQLAELWQVSPRTIRRMIADGRLPVVRLGRAVRIRVQAVSL
jgi:excisionase family DNA binding protein